MKRVGHQRAKILEKLLDGSTVVLSVVLELLGTWSSDLIPTH